MLFDVNLVDKSLLCSQWIVDTLATCMYLQLLELWLEVIALKN